MDKGKYEIINNEGMICYVNTTKTDGEFYGQVWSDICQSILCGKVLESVIDRQQYKTMKGESINDTPTGYIIKIQDEIEAFLPMSKSSFQNFDQDFKGKRIAVMIEDFDPMSKSIVVKELRTTNSDFEIDKINDTVDLIGKALNEEKYIRGTITDEKINNGHGNRAGYLVTINGLEGFLPSSLSYFPNDVIEHLIGHHVLASIENIDLEKMSIILSMKVPYQKLISELSPPIIGKKTKGILTWVTPYNAILLLPGETIGLIPRYRHPENDSAYWNDLTGTVIECIPYRQKFSNNPDENNSFYVRLDERY